MQPPAAGFSAASGGGGGGAPSCHNASHAPCLRLQNFEGTTTGSSQQQLEGDHHHHVQQCLGPGLSAPLADLEDEPSSSHPHTMKRICWGVGSLIVGSQVAYHGAKQYICDVDNHLPSDRKITYRRRTIAPSMLFGTSGDSDMTKSPPPLQQVHATEYLTIPSPFFNGKPLMGTYLYQGLGPVGSRPTMLWLSSEKCEGDASAEDVTHFQKFVENGVNVINVCWRDNQFGFENWLDTRDEVYSVLKYVKENLSDRVDWSNVLIGGSGKVAHLALEAAANTEQDFGGVVLIEPKFVRQPRISLIPFSRYFFDWIPFPLFLLTSIKRSRHDHWASQLTRPLLLWSGGCHTEIKGSELFSLPGGTADKWWRVCKFDTTCGEYRGRDMETTVMNFAHLVANKEPIGAQMTCAPVHDCLGSTQSSHQVKTALEELTKRYQQRMMTTITATATEPAAETPETETALSGSAAARLAACQEESEARWKAGSAKVDHIRDALREALERKDIRDKQTN